MGEHAAEISRPVDCLYALLVFPFAGSGNRSCAVKGTGIILVNQSVKIPVPGVHTVPAIEARYEKSGRDWR